MAISKIKGSAIQDATIPEDKLEDEAGSFRMILDGTDGSATNAGDFVLLDATASSTNVGEQFLFEPATDDGSAVLSGDLNLEMDKKSTIKSEGGAVTTNIGQGLAKVWVNLRQASVHTVKDSFNITSITDHDAGETIISWANTMLNIDYVHSGMAGQNHTALLNISQPENEHPPTTGNAQYNCSYANSSNFDGTFVGVVLYGDLA